MRYGARLVAVLACLVVVACGTSVPGGSGPGIDIAYESTSWRTAWTWCCTWTARIPSSPWR